MTSARLAVTGEAFRTALEHARILKHDPRLLPDWRFFINGVIAYGTAYSGYSKAQATEIEYLWGLREAGWNARDRAVRLTAGKDRGATKREAFIKSVPF